jgi:hypothetical protein
VVPCALAALAALAAISCGGRAPAAPPPASVGAADAETEIARELDDMNEAAAHAEEARYLDHFATGAVFMGTDATERWDVAALRAYAHPKFSQGHGWTLRSVRRAVTVWRTGDVAWFDEDLAGVKLGPARGSGVMVRVGGRWKVAQYNLSLTIPNERFAEVRALLDAADAPPTTPTPAPPPAH